jgi:hypothetical protein
MLYTVKRSNSKPTGETEMTDYNGWTNYATWRVNLEIFDGMDVAEYFGDQPTPDDMRQFVEDHIIGSTSDGLARDYALAFISDVNWYEIAKHYIVEGVE